MAKQEGILCISTVLFLPLDTGLKLSKMPMTRFPKQALVMLKNRLDTNTTHKNRNWAGSIKDCLESYGFHDVWTMAESRMKKFSSQHLNNE